MIHSHVTLLERIMRAEWPHAHGWSETEWTLNLFDNWQPLANTRRLPWEFVVALKLTLQPTHDLSTKLKASDEILETAVEIFRWLCRAENAILLHPYRVIITLWSWDSESEFSEGITNTCSSEHFVFLHAVSQKCIMFYVELLYRSLPYSSMGQ